MADLSTSTERSTASLPTAARKISGRCTPSRRQALIQYCITLVRNPRTAAIRKAALIKVGATLYGTTYLGRASNVGTIFKVTMTGTETLLHSFDTTRGKYPNALLLNIGEELYGTTTAGGSDGFGVVFSYLL